MSKIDSLLKRGPNPGDNSGGLQELREEVLKHGIPSTAEGLSDSRILIWLLLLNASFTSTDSYVQLVARGPSPAYNKIKNDTFRTLASDPIFKRRVNENYIIRILNSVAWRMHDLQEQQDRLGSPSIGAGRPHSAGHGHGHSHGGEGGSAMSRARAFSVDTASGSVDGSEVSSANQSSGYVQGMNVLAAPFIWAARSEVQAFTAFEKLLVTEIPAYVRGSMAGVHKGVDLIDQVLEVVDPELSAHLQSVKLSAKIYAFNRVMTLSACTPPLSELLQLWDFLFAFGPHMNILCIVAQLVIIRDQLLASPSPNTILNRQFPALHAETVKRLALRFVRQLPESLWTQIEHHAK